jgi:hypothetical protein
MTKSKKKPPKKRRLPKVSGIVLGVSTKDGSEPSPADAVKLRRIIRLMSKLSSGNLTVSDRLISLSSESFKPRLSKPEGMFFQTVLNGWTHPSLFNGSHRLQNSTGHKRVISLENCFHVRTLPRIDRFHLSLSDLRADRASVRQRIYRARSNVR